MVRFLMKILFLLMKMFFKQGFSPIFKLPKNSIIIFPFPANILPIQLFSDQILSFENTSLTILCRLRGQHQITGF